MDPRLQLFARHSSEYIQFDEPATVIDAIREVHDLAEKSADAPDPPPSSRALAHLRTSRPRRANRAAIFALIAIYGAVPAACTVETIAHTPGCFNFAN